jgi:predicted esterase YcpF (UPF0227 family)
LVLLEADDDVIDPNETIAALDDVYDVRMIEGGSHRFDSLPAQLSEIQDFFD